MADTRLADALKNQPPIKPAGGTPPAPSKPAVDPFLIGTYAGRLNRAILGISNGMKTQYATGLHVYLKHVSPKLADDKDNSLPHALHPHGTSTPLAPRSTSPYLYGNLTFLIGSAIVAFYDVVHGAKTETLDAQLAHLEAIADKQPSAYVVDGSDTKGFVLIPKIV